MSSLDVRHILHSGYHIEASAVLIAEKWYPLFRILAPNLTQVHRWQVPAVDGVDDPYIARKVAVSLGCEVIDQNPVGYWQPQ